MPAFDYDALEERRRADLSRIAPPSVVPDRDDEELGFFSAAADVLLAPARGVLGAGQSILSLADTLAFDLIPDFLHETPILGESRTFVGQALEGLTQFATGFIPGLGFVRGAAAFSRLGRLGQAAAAGGIADFAVFKGNEARLANLIESIPALRNPVTQFLAADEGGEDELAGRLKNVLEGGILGGAIDGTVAALGFGMRRVKATRAARKARPAASAESIAKQVEEEVPLTPEIQKAQDASLVPPDDPMVTLRTEIPGDDPESLARFLTADDAGVRKVLDAFEFRGDKANKVNPRDLTPEQRLNEAIQETDINLDHFQGPEGAMQLWRSLEGLTREQAKLVLGTVKRTVEEQQVANLDALTSIMGEGDAAEQTLARLTAEARQLGESQVEMTAKIGALNITAQKYVAEGAAVAQKILRGEADDRDLARFAQHMGTLADFLNVVKGLGSESGRQLRFRQNTVDLLDPDELEALVKEFGGEGRIKKLAERVQTLWDQGGSPHQVVKFLQQHPKLAATQEWWVGSMLSRVSTAAVDLTSAIGFAAYRPMNAIVGGLATGKSDAVRMGVYQITHFASGWADAMRAWGRTFKTKQNLIDAPAFSRAKDLGAGESRSALSPASLGVDPGSGAGRLLSLMGRGTQTIFGVLKANEEFVKTLTTHSYGKALLTEEAISRGLRGKELSKAVDGGFTDILRDGQLLSRKVLYNEGLDNIRKRGGLTTGFQASAEAGKYADSVLASPRMDKLSVIAEKVRERGREVTFTRRAAEQDDFARLSRSIQDFRTRHPMTRFVLPFVNTPINIVQSGLQQIDPVGPIRYALAKAFSESRFIGAAALEKSRNRFIRDMLSNDSERVADAVGRMAMGLGGMATFGALAYSGVITGKGPKDPKLRRQLQNAGWRPYSIRIGPEGEAGTKFISYSRLEPIATVMGIAADAMTASKWLPPEDQGGIQQAVLGGAMSLANQATNKTFLKGLADFFSFMTDPEVRAEDYLGGFLGVLAVPGAVQQFTASVDPHFREARTVVDRILQRVPGLSTTLPPSRNLLGEEIPNGTVFQDVGAFMGQRYGVTSDDVVTKELAGLGGFYPPGVSRLGVDLRDVTLDRTNAYDRFLALHGKVKVGGRTLRRSLGELIKSRAYQDLPAEGTDVADSPRRLVLQRVIARYRRQAWYTLLDETPALEARRQQQFIDRQSLFSGRPGSASTDPEGFLSR